MQEAPIRVLVIDDDPDAWFLVAAQLAELPGGRYLAEWSADAADARVRLREDRHDLYLLDLRLGADSGLDLLHEARAAGCARPILLLTSIDDPRADDEAMQTGADDFLVKGETTPELLDRALRHALERARARADLARQTARLARSNADLAEFAFAVSHDLRAPLGTLDGLLELAAEEPGLSEEGQGLLARARQTIARMSGLIGDMLAFASAGDPGPAEPVHLDAALDCALDDLSRELARSGARVHREPLPVAWGSPRLVEQVFQNLLSNAIKYSAPEVPELRVWARALPEGQVEVAVADAGCGMAPDKVESAFGMLQRLHGGEVPGTGIGLATCRRAVEAMGGRITAESRPGEGTVMRFTLPLEPPG